MAAGRRGPGATASGAPRPTCAAMSSSRADARDAAGAQRSRRTSSSSCACCSRARCSPRPPATQVEHGNGARDDRRRGDGRRRRFEHDQAKIDNADPPPAALRLYLLAARHRSRRCSCSLVVCLLFGRERRTGYDREYEQEPPTDTAARARADAAAPGRRGRVVRVHGDALRPDPPRRLHLEAGHDRAEDLGRAAEARRSPISSSPGARRRQLTPWEKDVAAVVNGVLAAGRSGSRTSATGSRRSARR